MTTICCGATGALLKADLLSEELVFTLFPNPDIIEILEPIEMAMVDKYGGKGDQYLPLVYRRWLKWKKRGKIDQEMELPLNPEAYAEAKSQKSI